MAYCPVCFRKFSAQARCPRHGALVSHLHKSVSASEGSPRPVAKVWSEPLAQSFAEVLRNNGIDAFVRTLGVGFSIGAPMVLGYEAYIVVPEAFVGRSADILEGLGEPDVLQIVAKDRHDPC